jgi:hypothetical protein
MAKRTKKTRVTNIECASALEYREFRCFAAKDPDRAGCRLLDDGRIEVTDNDRFAYILRLHSGKEIVLPPPACEHVSETTANGYGAYCKHCGETLA